MGGILIIAPLLNDLLSIPSRVAPGIFQLVTIAVGLLLIAVGLLPRLYALTTTITRPLIPLVNHLPAFSFSRLPILPYAILLAAHLKLFWGIPDFWDIPQADGGWYYYFASTTAQTLTLPSADWSPLYTSFYALFHLIFAPLGALTLYTIHRVTVLLILNLLLYTFLRRLLSPLTALTLVAWAMLLGSTLFNPFIVHHFVLIPLLLAFIAATSATRRREPLITLALIAASYVRPEYRVAVMLYAAYLAYTAIRERRYVARIALIATAALTLIVPALAPSPDGGRAELAFGQHIAWTYHDQNPDWEGYYWSEWEEVWAMHFGAAETVGEAARANPRAVGGHIAWNLRLLPSSVLDAFEPVSRVFEAGALILLVAALSEGVMHGRAAYLRVWVRHRDLWLAMACAAAATLIACAVIRPRTTYLIALMPLVFAGIGMSIDAALRRLRLMRLAAAMLPLVGVMIIALMPPLFTGTRPKPAYDIVQQVIPHAPTDSP